MDLLHRLNCEKIVLNCLDYTGCFAVDMTSVNSETFVTRMTYLGWM